MFKVRKRYINFLIIPEGSSRNINFRLTFWKTWMILGLLGFLIIFLIILSVLYGNLISGVTSAKSLHRENERLQEYNARVVELEKELQEYRKFTKRIAELAGVEYPFPSDLSLYGEGQVSSPRRDTGLALSHKEDYSSSKNMETISELPVYGESLKNGSERSPHDQHPFGRLAGLDKIQVESDSLRHIPKGQPIDGWISRGFSKDAYVFGGEHTGVDFAAKEGTEVKVTADGIVSFTGWDDIYGNLVIVDHKNGYVSYYGHNSRILVNSGSSVKRGQVIALSGNSGRSSAPHLHYEIRKNDIPVDPKDFMNPK
jgi:murein DD-endopeptidase MepM/ murein hydrolase activator NlpD